jgi:peptide/nickel transport system permease protein
VATLFGLCVGVVAGYYGGWVDQAFLILADGMEAFPGLILAMALIAVLGPSLENVVIALVAGSAFRIARVMRTSVLSVSQAAYVEAARSMGASDARIMLRAVTPNVIPMALVLGSLLFATAMLTESTLSFLGLGPPPPTPTWGRMLADEGRAYFRSGPWLAIAPGVALTLGVYSLNLLGDALRDHLDPRARRR